MPRTSSLRNAGSVQPFGFKDKPGDTRYCLQISQTFGVLHFITLVLLLTETRPTWGWKGQGKEENSVHPRELPWVYVCGLRGMKLLMQQSLSRADIRQMCKERFAVSRAKCFPSTPEQNQPLFPHMEFKSHL